MTTDKEILDVNDLMAYTNYGKTKCRAMFHAKGFPRCRGAGLRVYKSDFDAWFRGKPVVVPPETVHTALK